MCSYVIFGAVSVWLDVSPAGVLLQGAVASVLPLGSCPCQSVIEKMTEEADQAEDIQEEFTSNGDLDCHRGRGEACVCVRACVLCVMWPVSLC